MTVPLIADPDYRPADGAAGTNASPRLPTRPPRNRLAAFRGRAIPSPAPVTRGPQRLPGERRNDVPVTVISTEFTSGMLREWIEQG